VKKPLSEMTGVEINVEISRMESLLRSGVSRSSYKDRSTDFQSPDHIRATLDEYKRALASRAGTPRRGLRRTTERFEIR
jgi:hypothetical protein